MSHSVRAKTNMTKQMQAQLDFFEQNLKKKEKRFKFTKKLRIFKLPGLRKVLERQKRGIIIINKDLSTIKSQIIQMQKDNKINVIIDV